MSNVHVACGRINFKSKLKCKDNIKIIDEAITLNLEAPHLRNKIQSTKANEFV